MKTLSLALALAASLLPLQASDTWFEFRPDNKNGPSVIGMESWLPAPAGAQGRVLMKRDRLVLEKTGEPIKFWGVNLGGSDCTPSREMADYWAERFARYGINAVRFHKPWDQLYTKEDSTKLRPEPLARFDYFCHALRQRGIYYTWSFFYHRRLGATDLKRLSYPEEFQNPDGKNGNVYGATDYIPEIQDILIEATENLLRHENPHTGLTYAEDPALACIEFQNEASIMFWSDRGLRSMPSYEREVAARFSDWLRGKYRNHAGLLAAWGEKALNLYHYKDEHLDSRNILVVARPEDYATDRFNQFRTEGTFRRVSDTAEFLHTLQNEFYDRFTDRVRALGYTGPLVGSCWRGKGDVSEYYNLLSDARVGIIDRHNYFGGLDGWRPRPGSFAASSQINNPGGGLLSSGMVQVADRPYAFSEWATVFPNEYVVESPSLIAIYGLGLQGWDASYQFATNTAGRGYSEALHKRNLLWVIERPENIGIYPAIARMIYRGDVAEGEVISTRRLSMDDLRDGALPWGSEHYSGWKDVKTYVGPMPGKALGAGRIVVAFTPSPVPSDMPFLDPLLKDGVLHSNTGQLRWDMRREKRYFVAVDTPGTKAVIGFAPDEPVELGAWKIGFSEAPFAAVFVTSLDREGALDTAKSALVTVVGRAANTGMVFNEARNELIAIGDGPVRLEPVRVSLRTSDRLPKEIQVLDHDGRRTGKTLPVSGPDIILDGAEHKTLYYELVW